MKRITLLTAAILLLLVPSSIARDGDAPPFTASQFASLIARLSEEGGFFWNDNFVSNEVSYLHPLGKMRALGIQG